MIVVGATVSNLRDAVSPIRIFAEFFGKLVEFRQPRPAAAGIWVNHGSPDTTTCIGLPSIALVDDAAPARQLRVFFHATDGHLRVARFPAATATPVFDDHGTPPGGLQVDTPPGALIVEQNLRTFWQRLRDPGRRPARYEARPADGLSIQLPVYDETYRMYMGSSTGTLLEHKIVGPAADLQWTDLGSPPTPPGVPARILPARILGKPGAPYFGFPNPRATAGLFIVTTLGSVFEFILEGSAANTWVPHGSPMPGIEVRSAPRAVMIGADGQSVTNFFLGSDDDLYQLTAPTTGVPGVWSMHPKPMDAAGTSYDLQTGAGGLSVTPFPGDVYFQFFIVGTSNPVRTKSHLIGIPEDRLFLRRGNIAPTSHQWVDEGPSTALPLGNNPQETLNTPRALGQDSNGVVDYQSMFVGTSLDRLLEFDQNANVWTDHGAPPRGTPCVPPGPFNVGLGC